MSLITIVTQHQWQKRGESGSLPRFISGHEWWPYYGNRFHLWDQRGSEFPWLINSDRPRAPLPSHPRIIVHEGETIADNRWKSYHGYRVYLVQLKWQTRLSCKVGKCNDRVAQIMVESLVFCCPWFTLWQRLLMPRAAEINTFWW